jgi:hypothetical protein
MAISAVTLFITQDVSDVETITNQFSVKKAVPNQQYAGYAVAPIQKIIETHKDLLKHRKLHLTPSQRNKNKSPQITFETNTTQDKSQNFPPLPNTSNISKLLGNHTNNWSKNEVPAENNLTNLHYSFINEFKSIINPMIVIEKFIKDGR